MRVEILERLQSREETLWLNPQPQSVEPFSRVNGYGFVHVKAAQNRLMRFMPWVAAAFPETAEKKGLIESRLLPAEPLKERLNAEGAGITGRVMIKDDAHLPLAGSVKARGGVHEVLKIAEELAQKEGLLRPTESYGKLYSEEFRRFFGQYTIQAGSTGNLGVSIGRTAARLGFRVVIHMSSDAREWKKALLRSEGVTVREYGGDYGQAVAQGRAESEKDPFSFFIDDENSPDLFFGYATAALRLKIQLEKAGIPVDAAHPLFVYLPCGVGGAPGGITYGLKQLYGDAVHCFTAEPVEAPCMLLSLATGKNEAISVQDIGLSGKTAADGLAVGRASGFVCRTAGPMFAGGCTVTDEHLEHYRQLVHESMDLRLEPSACAGLKGLDSIQRPGSEWNGVFMGMENATHILWATGGGLMPAENAR